MKPAVYYWTRIFGEQDVRAPQCAICKCNEKIPPAFPFSPPVYALSSKVLKCEKGYEKMFFLYQIKDRHKTIGNARIAPSSTSESDEEKEEKR